MNQSSKLIESFEISKDAQAKSQQLSLRIADEIKAQGGHISFSAFMQMALYQPKLGYYQNLLHKFGDKGDFVTAPEMGSLFAQCLANAIAGYFNQSSSSQTEKLLEIGAGSGILAVNLLKALDKLGALPHQYFILEPSASLQNQQQVLLKQQCPQYYSKIVWLNELPKNFTGVMVANEVVDAIPCNRFIKRNGEWYSLQVCCKNEGFEDYFEERAANKDLPEFLLAEEETSPYPDGYVFENRPLINGWMSALAESLQQGAIILADYGYPERELYHPQRDQGTLTCFVRHHAHNDPYQLIGLQDITAHVDFSEVARCADLHGLSIQGYTTQAGFLLENGITDMSQKQSNISDPKQQYQISQQVQQLLMPGQMGEVIKVILLEKNSTFAANGFSLQDHLYRL